MTTRPRHQTILPVLQDHWDLYKCSDHDRNQWNRDKNEWFNWMVYTADRMHQRNCLACSIAHPQISKVPFRLDSYSDLNGFLCALQLCLQTTPATPYTICCHHPILCPMQLTILVLPGLPVQGRTWGTNCQCDNIYLTLSGCMVFGPQDGQSWRMVGVRR